ncbi:MAG: hypothetical protein Q4G71_03870 [Pseudomonadota bacterium]|nr:hypothetical protein [Pseudomonadota bacterium]
MATAVVAREFDAVNQLAVIETESASAVRALARELGYDGPLGAPALMDGARSAKRRVGMAIMEFGAYLLLIKAGCAHGEFGRALVELEIVPDTARTYMALARRFAKRATSPVLEGLGFCKAAELLPLADEQIDELADLGQTGELALDDVARMSIKELRAAVRKERTVSKRQEAVNGELNAELVRLRLDKKVLAHTDWPDALAPVSEQVAAAGRKLATAVSELQSCRIAIFEAAEALAGDERPAFEAALAHVAEVYEQALARAERQVERERGVFDKTLGAFAQAQPE